MKKKLICLFISLSAVMCSLPVLPGCSSEAYLEYTLSEDGTHYIVNAAGSPTALKDTDFNIAKTYGEVLDEETGEVLQEALPVTEIATMGFLQCSSLFSIVIPDSITKIGQSAFAYCSNLQSVKLSENLEELPYGIFGYCSCLKSIDIPASVKTIGTGAFMYSCLENVVIPETVEEIGEGAFFCEYYVESVDIRCEIEVIPHYMFYNCISLESVTLPGTVTKIEGTETRTDENGETLYDDEGNERTALAAFCYSSSFSSGNISMVYNYVLSDLYFNGTEESLSQMEIGEGNFALSDSSMNVYYMDGGEYKKISWTLSVA